MQQAPEAASGGSVPYAVWEEEQLFCNCGLLTFS